MRSHRRICACRGTSTLEFIVVLPALLLIFLASVELSRAWLTLNLVTQAAREGARVGAATSPFDPAAAIQRINEVLCGGKPTSDALCMATLASAAASVTLAAPGAPDSPVTATVTMNFDTVVPLMLPILAGPVPITETAVMRFEGP